MSEPIAPRSACRRTPFQFSLRTVLLVVTGLCIILSLAAWQRTLGTGLGILIVGSLWTAAAVRSGWRRLAYHLASVPMGVIAHLVVFSPISLLTFIIPDIHRTPMYRGRAWLLLIVMCIAMSAAAAMLRRRIRSPGRRCAVISGLLATYVAAAVWMLCVTALRLVLPVPFGSELAQLVERWAFILFLVVIGILVGPTISLYLAWPLAILFCVILRRIDPLERAPDATGQDTVTHAAQGASPPVSPTDGARVASPPERATRD